jgi:hypothetical protein
MSDKPNWSQANHTLTLISQQDPSPEDIRTLHDGYLTALVCAIKIGKIPPLHDFRRSIGLIKPQTANLKSEIITLDAVGPHKTSECFLDRKGIDIFRDPNLDKWTPQRRNAHKGGEYKVTTIKKSLRFSQMAGQILGIKFNANTNEKELQMLLIQGGHCIEMEQIDNLIDRFEKKEGESGLKKGEHGTFFFIDNGDGTCSVVYVWLHSVLCKWYVDIFRFEDDTSWTTGHRFVYCNLDPSDSAHR